ncbi:MFS transporter [Streptomyces glaucosporus]|uniref:MFS transporter n=1 Tax=Streptomyces glaucosporus TaxID=284044 RepID=A0ABN3HK12_9ACTN
MSFRTAQDGPSGEPVPLRTGMILTACCLGQLMVMLDASILNVALPVISEALEFDQHSLQWVINAFMIPTAGFLLLAGRMADLFGRRRLFLVGVVLFTAASLAGGLSYDATTLILARALQGLGAAIMAPATLTVLGTTFTEPEARARAFGLWGAVAGGGGALGVILGGIITEWTSWRWVLLINVPVGIALYLMIARSVPETRAPGERKLDVLGALSVTFGLVTLVYGIAEGESYGWGSARIVTVLGLSAALIAFFLYDQARIARQPLIPLGVFRHRSLSLANLVMLGVGAALAGTFYFLTLLFQMVLGYTPLETGVAYLPLSLSVFVGAGGISVLVGRIGPRPVLLTGLSLAVAGLLWFSRADENAAFAADLLGPSLLFGFGVGMVMTSVTTAATSDLPSHQQGLSSGLLTTTETLGGAAGLAVLVAVANSRTEEEMAGRAPTRELTESALASGFGLAFLTCAFVLVASLLAAFALPRGIRGEGGHGVPAEEAPSGEGDGGDREDGEGGPVGRAAVLEKH